MSDLKNKPQNSAHTLSICADSTFAHPFTYLKLGVDSNSKTEKPETAKHPQEDEEYLLCVKCGKATCPGCD